MFLPQDFETLLSSHGRLYVIDDKPKKKTLQTHLVIVDLPKVSNFESHTVGSTVLLTG